MPVVRRCRSTEPHVASPLPLVGLHRVDRLGSAVVFDGNVGGANPTAHRRCLLDALLALQCRPRRHGRRPRRQRHLQGRPRCRTTRSSASPGRARDHAPRRGEGHQRREAGRGRPRCARRAGRRGHQGVLTPMLDGRASKSPPTCSVSRKDGAKARQPARLILGRVRETRNARPPDQRREQGPFSCRSGVRHAANARTRWGVSGGGGQRRPGSPQADRQPFSRPERGTPREGLLVGSSTTPLLWPVLSALSPLTATAPRTALGTAFDDLRWGAIAGDASAAFGCVSSYRHPLAPRRDE